MRYPHRPVLTTPDRDCQRVHLSRPRSVRSLRFRTWARRVASSACATSDCRLRRSRSDPSRQSIRSCPGSTPERAPCCPRRRPARSRGFPCSRSRSSSPRAAAYSSADSSLARVCRRVHSLDFCHEPVRHGHHPFLVLGLGGSTINSHRTTHDVPPE